MATQATVREVGAAEAHAQVPALATVLMDCVANGASVNFMNPFPRERAEAFWAGIAAGVARGERVLFVGEHGGQVVGTVQLVLTVPENQPHRAEISKMLVHSAARRQGIGAALMRPADAAALERGRTLLVLDTMADSPAERLYSRLGWTAFGRIPDYALFPDGGFGATTFFYKALAPQHRSA